MEFCVITLVIGQRTAETLRDFRERSFCEKMGDASWRIFGFLKLERVTW